MNLDAIADRIMDELNLYEDRRSVDVSSIESEIVERAMRCFVEERLREIDCYAIDDPDPDKTPAVVDIVNKVRSRLKKSRQPLRP